MMNRKSINSICVLYNLNKNTQNHIIAKNFLYYDDISPCAFDHSISPGGSITLTFMQLNDDNVYCFLMTTVSCRDPLGKSTKRSKNVVRNWVHMDFVWWYLQWPAVSPLCSFADIWWIDVMLQSQSRHVPTVFVNLFIMFVWKCQVIKLPVINQMFCIKLKGFCKNVIPWSVKFFPFESKSLKKASRHCCIKESWHKSSQIHLWTCLCAICKPHFMLGITQYPDTLWQN